MDPAHHCLRLADQDPQPTRLLDQHFPPHNPSKLDMEVILLICSSKAMACTVAKLAPMQVV